MPVQVLWTEDSIDISVEYDAQDRISKVFVTVPRDLYIIGYRFDGTEVFNELVTVAGNPHEYAIPPGQLKRNEDLVTIRTVDA